MHVLYLSPRESWPAKSGSRLRDLYFARALAQKTNLVYLYFSTAPEQSQLPEQITGARKVYAVRAPKKYTPLKIARGLIGGRPLPIENYTASSMMSAIEGEILATPFDLVHLDSIHLAAYGERIAKLAPQIKVTLDWHNIESELLARYASQAASVAHRYYADWTANRLRRLESAFLQKSYGHLVCSQREQMSLHERAPDARIAVIENGVATDYFRPEPEAPLTNRLVFVGQMSYHANADGLLWFVREIWPQLRAAQPGLTLSVVGSDPGPAVRALASEQGVEVTGTVPDVRPYYAGALAAIVPLLTGGGTRLKVLEGMAAGVPVISTKLGAEGLNVRSGEDCFEVGNDPAEWLRAVQLAGDAATRQRITEAARKRVCAEYDWTRIGDRLANLYLEWGNAAADPPLLVG